MLNAHLRFGWLTFHKATERKTTSVRVRLDRLIAEPPVNRSHSAKAHLLSVIAGDTQMAAISAALSEGGHFTVEGPDLEARLVSVAAKKPQCYRGSIQVSGRKRPLRHLVAISDDLAGTSGATKIVLADSNPDFVWSAVAKIHGLPGTPQWAAWFYDQLVCRNCIVPLLSIGCAPIQINAHRKEILSWLGDGMRSGALTLPDENRAIRWPQFDLKSLFHSPNEDAVPATTQSVSQ